MNDLPAVSLPALRVPAKPEPRPLDKLLSASGPVFMAVFDPHHAGRDAAALRDAIACAERFLASAAAVRGQLVEAAEVEDADAIGRQLNAFVEAWPNASRSDLTGYGLQLADDVMDRQPCRYALRSALRRLRQTSRFLPSIAEVLCGLDEATGRLRNTAFHLQELPALLDRARADLARAQGRQCRQSPDTSEATP